MNYYYLYRITNIITNEIYIGVHETSNLNDNYMGSGKLLLEKYIEFGKENFKKEILEFFENSELMFSKEEQIVNSEFVSRKDTYNLISGGKGLSSKRAKEIGQLTHIKKIRSETMRRVDQKLWNTPKHREKITSTFKKQWEDPEFRENQSKRIKKFNEMNWKNPQFREKQSTDRINTIFIINRENSKRKRIFIEDLGKYPVDLWKLSGQASRKIKKILLLTLLIIHKKNLRLGY